MKSCADGISPSCRTARSRFKIPPAGGPADSLQWRVEQRPRPQRDLKTLAVQQQAVVRAEVSAAGVVDVQPGRVELLLYVNQYRRNTAVTGEKVDQNRVVLTTVPDGNTCKVAKAEAI
jgi:Mce-associated membrane protein